MLVAEVWNIRYTYECRQVVLSLVSSGEQYYILLLNRLEYLKVPGKCYSLEKKARILFNIFQAQV